MGSANVPEYGETWVYESIIGALPGISVSRPLALAIQLVAFEVGILALAWYYDLWAAALAGTAAVFVAAIGSVEMLRISTLTRSVDVPESYRRLLFGSSVEVVLAVLAYVALVTHLFVFDPQQRAGGALVEQLFGPDPPVLVVYLTLLVLWDVCYRIGTNWWAAVTAVWRAATFRLDAETRRAFRRADLETMVFGLLQVVLVPFVLEQPVILAALVGHVAAVTVATGLAVALSYRYG
ncbi:hypothetical protein N0B31_16470 [Salinirubellus salinus]|jgi:hypothetical protein|uniref:Uncharacterized protein n=1 Tax=Salinirubellus salinus TaxID=1364945 RepID=A0A9E7UAF0_9EURY|nr:hypothetical protein [Salinirubellus salinus]UWM53719.1 hypothetical protein N0B31_16470 [Salinirubellus salinus]